ncbi:MAG: sugar kinase [Deltaproteobacteria bacterium]|nr:MAG: sugar kinase [Deltaproteobacteria bacterium]TMB25106.1 MAG: sugar kinase [Deltaproteobacteria bacterium]
MNADLAHLLDRFSRARIVAVGDLVADEFVYGETDRISREAPVLIVRYESAELKPGCGANAIMNLCALGARVQAIGLIGDDEIGRRLRAQLVDAGADDSAIFAVDGPTSTKTRVLAGGKNTRRQQMLRIDRDGPAPPGQGLAQKLVKALAQAAAKCDAIMISDYGLGLLTPALVEAVRTLAGQGRTVCVDARYGLAKYRGVTVVKPNEVELEQSVGRGIGDDPLALEEAGRELLKSLRAQALLVTRGRSGMALLRPGAPTALVPVHGSADAVDVTGAGDTVMAAATVAVAAGGDPVQAMRIANVAGALKVQKPGTVPVSAQELRTELARVEVAQPTLVVAPRAASRGRR